MKKQQKSKFFIKFIASCLVWTVVLPGNLSAQSEYSGAQRIDPERIGRKGNAEFYTSSSDARVVIPVNIWGEIQMPGVHYMPVGTSISKLISAAGGPTSTAALPEVRVLRNKKIQYVDLFDNESFLLEGNDTIVVEKSIKSDLPLILSSIGTFMSIVTFALVVSQRKK